MGVMLRNGMHTVPMYALPRSDTRWLLVRGDLDPNGRLHRSGIAHLVSRNDGRWEWRACGRHCVADSRELAELAIQATWIAAAPSDASERCCSYCGEALPAGCTSRRRFCVTGGCRVAWNRARSAGPDTAIRVRKRSTRSQMGRVERAAARARAQADL